MIKISVAGVWVHDQDEALAFYTDKLGWEVRADVTLPEMGNYRWLTVGPPSQPRRRKSATRNTTAANSRPMPSTKKLHVGASQTLTM